MLRHTFIACLWLFFSACALAPTTPAPESTSSATQQTQGPQLPFVDNTITGQSYPFFETSLHLQNEFIQRPVQITQAEKIETPVQENAAIADWAPEKTGSLAENQAGNLWDRIRAGFEFNDSNFNTSTNRRVQKQLDWYSRHQEYLNRVADRASPYLHYILEALDAEGIPSEIALLPIVESAFQPFAYSHGRASGIWQFIPSTGRRYGLKQNWWYDGRRDIHASTQAAIKLLKNLHREFKGDWLLALAAYNSGSGTVKKAVRRNRRRGKPTDFFSLKLPPETRSYVPKLLALKRIVEDPWSLNLTLKPIPDVPYLSKVDIDSQIDLALAAELADLELDTLYTLNPGYNRWATSPKGPHYLLLPLDKQEGFKEQLARLPVKDRIRWKRHKVRKGETISTIAEKYYTSIGTIKRVNHIRGNRIRAGKSLMIPVASRKLRKYKLSATQRKSKLQNIPRKGKKITHIIRRGDTFWDLARHHRVSVRQLAKWNGMAPRDPLKLGERLIIWSRRGDSLSYLEPSSYDAPPRRRVTKRIGYRVRRGDSLSRISNRFKVSVAQLRRWNRLPKGKYLQPGQRLTVYVDVIRQSS